MAHTYRYMCQACNRSKKNETGYTHCSECTAIARHCRRLAEMATAAGGLRGVSLDVTLARVWWALCRTDPRLGKYADEAKAFAEYCRGASDRRDNPAHIQLELHYETRKP